MRTSVWILLCLIVAATGFLAAAYSLRSKPVLLHVFAEKDCACGDFHEDVSGVVFLNPFRDSLPEKRAAKFLGDLREGKCIEDASICRYSLNGHRASDWRLVSRRNVGNRVLLFYRLTKLEMADSRGKLTGEGSIAVENAGGDWIVVTYSSYF